MFRRTIILATILATAACIQPETSREQCDILYQCVRVELGESPSARQNKETLDFIFSELELLNNVIHPDKIGGITRLNDRLGTGEWSSINPSLLQLTRDARALAEKSNNTFNPAIGKLINLWGFHRDPKQSATLKLPSTREILALVNQNPSTEDIEFDGIRVRSKNPAVAIHYGLLYQGHIVRLVRAILNDAGYRKASVFTNNMASSLGEDIRYAHTQGAPGYRLNAGETLCHTEIEDHGFTENSHYYHSYLDPDTGFPAPTIRSVTVIDDDPMAAAGGCQALMSSDGRDWEITGNMMQLSAVELAWKNDLAARNDVMNDRIAAAVSQGNNLQQ
ncbi:MAG: FAD:protein FMN transferase [Gammaproteobacteria bacterium]|nr:FAD:protein FMN transferase [Gammaproteobacteria bacterium]